MKSAGVCKRRRRISTVHLRKEQEGIYKMKKLTELLARGLLACTLVIVFLAVTTVAHAEYEIDTSPEANFSINVPTDGTVVQLKEDLVMSWEEPNMEEGSDVLNGYIYKWNNDPSTLSDDDFNIEYKDGDISNQVTAYQEGAAFFAEDDSSDIRYLHIKTWYTDNTSAPPNPFAYSADVVIGPINIDNVASTGTVRITDADRNDITTTYITSLILQLSATLSPVNMYLS